MTLRILPIGSAVTGLATFRRAAELSGVATIAHHVRSPHPEAVLGSAGAYDALCVLDPVPGLSDLVLAHGQSGKSVLLAGPPVEDAVEFDRIVQTFDRSRAALVVGGVLSQRPECRALCDLAGQGRVGAPVYLRYAGEAGGPESLFWHAADAIGLAVQVLGDPAELYATGVSDAAGALAHLALTLRHQDGSVALLGIGTSPVTRGHASLLLVGDRGVVETEPARGGLIVCDGDVAAVAYSLRDERADSLADWLKASEPALADAEARAAAIVRGRRLTAALAAVRRSLDRHSPERWAY